jgi:RNA polymerase sigma-B factor
MLVRLRFEEDLSQSEIGRQLGISQMHVSRLLRRALARMEAIASD